MKYTKNDYDKILKLLRMDLSAMQAKVTNLNLMLASLNLPEQEADPISTTQLCEKFIRNGGYELTDYSLEDEMHHRDVPHTEHERLLEFAGELRKEKADVSST